MVRNQANNNKNIPQTNTDGQESGQQQQKHTTNEYRRSGNRLTITKTYNKRIPTVRNQANNNKNIQQTNTDGQETGQQQQKHTTNEYQRSGIRPTITKTYHKRIPTIRNQANNNKNIPQTNTDGQETGQQQQKHTTNEYQWSGIRPTTTYHKRIPTVKNQANNNKNIQQTNTDGQETG